MLNTHLIRCVPRRTAIISRSARKSSGLTLVEVIVATAVTGLILVAALTGVSGSLRMWVVAERRGEAYGLAEQLMSEILQQAYKEPGSSTIGIDASPEVLTTRADWDDVDDYDGWSQAPQNKDGSAIVGYSSWNRSVNVDFVDRNDPHNVTGADVGLKRIRVTVTDPDGHATQLIAWRSQYGLLETPPEADTTVQSWVSNSLAKSGRASQAGAVLLNKPK